MTGRNEAAHGYSKISIDVIGTENFIVKEGAIDEENCARFQ